MTTLIKYDQARQALAACRSVDEIKDIRDKSEAMRLYAKQAQDTELEQWAAEIKLRAQRAIGELSAALETQKGGFGIVPTGGKHKAEVLADAGISTSAANRYEKLAAVPEPVIEEIIAKSRDAGKPVSAKAVMAQVAPRAPMPAATPAPPKASPSSLVDQVLSQQAAAGADSDERAVDPAPDDAPQGEPEVTADGDDDGDQFAQLLDDYHAAVSARDELQEKVRRLEEHITLLTRDDLATQVDYLVKRASDAEFKFEQLSGRNRDLQGKVRDTQLTAQYQADLLGKIRGVLGVEANGDILPALTARRAA